MKLTTITFLVFVLGSTLVSFQAAGQSVSVRVLNARTAEPIPGALVQLIGVAGSVAERGLTDDAGRALLRPTAPGADTFRIRVDMIGMASVETDPFVAPSGGSIHRDVSLEPQPLGLEGLAIEVDERCRVRPEATPTARVWEEARKALALSAFTERRRLYRYETMLYERDLDSNADVILEERVARREVSVGTPFRSRPAAELVERGFTEASGGVDLYFAPDAEVLLSDAFLDSHCFRLRPGEDDGETAGLIGLAFEPLRLSGRRVDISGTLWLDPTTSELEWLQYRYENLDPEIRSDALGGRVEFRRMPEGGWVIPKWWIRMPNVAVRRSTLTGRTRRYVTGIREAGGLVLEVEAAGRTVVRVGAGGIVGTVRDSTGTPAEGVEVELVGTDRAASTDSTGHYRLSGLVEGVYQLRFHHPELHEYGYRPTPLTRAVTRGETSDVDVELPPAGTVLRNLCRERSTRTPAPDDVPREAVEGSAILVGSVRDARTGEPLPGATVRATRSQWSQTLRHDRVTGETMGAVFEQPYSIETTADAAGFYVLCGLPEGAGLAVSGTHRGVTSSADTLRIDTVGSVAEHVVSISRPPGS